MAATVKITRSTAEVLSTLTPEQRNAVRRVRNAVRTVLQNDPTAICPPGAGHCYLMEEAGWVWDFAKGRYV